MKKLDPTTTVRRRKGLHLTEREIADVFGGGRYELEAERDYTGSASTAAQHLRDLWRAQRGHIKITADEKNGTVTVEVEPPLGGAR